MNDYDLANFNIGVRIKALADEQNNYAEINKKMRYGKFVSDIFIQKNLEGILVAYGLCHYQDYNFYIRFFNLLIAKYDMTDDYLKCKTNNVRWDYKWALFSHMVVALLSCSDDETRNRLFESDTIRNYLTKFHDFFPYTDCFKDFKWEPLSLLLELPCYQEEIINLKKEELNRVIINETLTSVALPTNILNNLQFIKKIANNVDFEEYIAARNHIEYHNSVEIIDEQHALFCDSLINSFNHRTKTFPVLKEKGFFYNLAYASLLKKLYESLKNKNIPVNAIHQEISKYIVIGFIFSRFFKASWYNLSIDMRTLVEYIDDPLRVKKFEFHNRDLYYKLLNFKELSVLELIRLYDSFKTRNIMHEFYDDWHNAQNEFVSELNSNTLNGKNLGTLNNGLTMMYNTPVYELNGQDYYIITRNTSIDVRDDNFREKLKGTKYSRSYLSLSVQDEHHLKYYTHEDCGRDTTYQLKLVYGNLDESYIGMIYPTDAYTNGLTSSEIGSFSSRKIYPLRKLMLNTEGFNDISYFKTDELQPIAVIVENELILEQLLAAQKLKLPIILRHNNLYKESHDHFKEEPSYVKHYALLKYIHL